MRHIQVKLIDFGFSRVSN
jgi:calcium-dependent protein kinase